MINHVTLSILQDIYTDIDQEADCATTISDQVVAEVRTLCRIFPLISSSLSARFADVVLATDASLSGGGVCVADITKQQQSRVLYSRRVRRGWWTPFVTDNPRDDANPMNFQMDPLVVDLIRKMEWRTVVSYRFRFKETKIVFLEARPSSRVSEPPWSSGERDFLLFSAKSPLPQTGGHFPRDTDEVVQFVGSVKPEPS